MDPASLGLAVIGTLEICFKYGKELVDFCREQRHLERDIGQLALIIEGVWIKTETQLGLLMRLCSSGTLEPVLGTHFVDVAHQLHIKLSAAIGGFAKTYLRSISVTSFPKRAQVVYLKRHLQKVAKDLEEWQRRFDPSWYLMSRIAEPMIDRELENEKSGEGFSASRLSEIRRAIQQSSQSCGNSSSVFVNPDTIMETTEPVSGTSTYLSRHTKDGHLVLLDSTNSTGANTPTARKAHIRDLAQLLSHVDPMSFGLLRCEGVLERKISQDPYFEFIFEIPKGLSSPKTLRSLLLQSPVCSLSKRAQLATQLARSVMFVHTTGFVHKGIRPETIVVFPQDEQDVGPSFLIGFEQVRRAEAQTSFLGDLKWERNLYRHPVRQGLWSEEAFTMEHDIYSLGVCLLELALWESFVCLDGNAATPWKELDIEVVLGDKDARRRGFAIKKKLVALTKARLPSLVGDRYTDVTLACLCCLDPSDNNVFNMPQAGIKDKDGIIVGVRYIENILTKLEELSV